MKQQTIRKQIADLIREMRRVPECVPKHQYLFRDWVSVQDTFSIEYLNFSSIEERVKEFCNQHTVESDDVSLATATVNVPYEDYEEQALTLFATVPETDLQYLARIETIYRDWLNELYAPIMHEQWSKLFQRINMKLYVARNITADIKAIEECLDALDRIYICQHHDSNGQMSDVDMRRKQKETYEQLNKQF